MRFWKRDTQGIRLALLLTSMIVLLVASSWFLHVNFENVREHQQWVRHSTSVINQLELTLSALKDAETGARGFILTKQEEYLEPYRMGVTEVWDHFTAARNLVSDSKEQTQRMVYLEGLVRDRLRILRGLLDEVKGSTQESILARSQGGLRDGKVIMDAIRSQAEQMKAHENDLLQKRTSEVETSRYFFFWSLILTTVLSSSVLTAMFTQVRRNQVRMMLEGEQKEEEAWIRSNIAEASRLTTGDITVQKAARQILQHFASTLDALAGSFYSFNGSSLELVAALSGAGEGGVIRAPQEFKSGEGLLGEAVQRREPWFVTDVPESYMNISSSLGQSQPKQLAFLPVQFQGLKLGIIELAFFRPLTEREQNLLLQILDSIGIGINAAQSRERLRSLLEETRQQAEELQVQQEELRTTNEELEQQARALESQQLTLNLQNRDLEESRQQIEAKAAELQRASQYKSEFLAKMSHELRTPLNSLLILATLLIENKERNLTDQQREFARSIHNAGNDLLNLINDILDLSKIEARKLTLKPEEFSLNSLMDQMRRTFEPLSQAKSLDLRLEVSGMDKGERLYTDRQRLEQIIRNFLSNAIKFTDVGHVTLKAEKSVHGLLKLSVSDSGIGIPDEKKHLIFEAFEQADGSVSRRYGGTGLGLTISRELASLLGGTIDLSSTEGEGSTFSLEIPMEMPLEAAGERSADVGARRAETRASDAAVRAPRRENAQASEAGETRLKPRASTKAEQDEIAGEAKQAIGKISHDSHSILIVEDDEVFRKSVVEAAKGYGFEPIEAASGEVAIEILNQLTPKAILLDIRLPGISGLGLLELIKQMPQLRHVPIHMISAMEHQQSALRMGALGYLTKPVTIDKVRSALGRMEKLIAKQVKRVLIVEDDDLQRTAVGHLVEGTDVEVLSASSGKEALQVVSEEGIDCIILDLSLPDISGYDFLEQLQSLEISLPPVVVYTGQDLSREEEERLRRYSESIIIKGARSPERLLDEVSLFLHRVEDLLPKEKREMLSQLRSQEKALEGKQVLVVDDDLRNVFALTSALESKGMQVRIAKDGIDALEALEKYPHVDLVLMDLMMPRMDGLEAMKRIRANDRFRHLPIIALTAKAMKEDAERCMEAGANDYLPKPINLANLVSVMRVWLNPKGIFA